MQKDERSGHREHLQWPGLTIHRLYSPVFGAPAGRPPFASVLEGPQKLAYSEPESKTLSRNRNSANGVPPWRTHDRGLRGRRYRSLHPKLDVPDPTGFELHIPVAARHVIALADYAEEKAFVLAVPHRFLIGEPEQMAVQSAPSTR